MEIDILRLTPEMMDDYLHFFDNIRNMLAYADGLKGEKGYLNSRGLNRNIVLRSWIGAEQNDFQACKDSLDKQIKIGLKCSYKHVTEHRYIGKRESEDGIFVEKVPPTAAFPSHKERFENKI